MAVKKYDFGARASVHELPKRFFIVYTGQHKVLELSGVGKITIGQEYEVSEEVANSVRQMPDWIIVKR